MKIPINECPDKWGFTVFVLRRGFLSEVWKVPPPYFSKYLLKRKKNFCRKYHQSINFDFWSSITWEITPHVSKRFVYHMSTLGSWRFGYIKIDQHLLPKPSIYKQRELSCAPDIFICLWIWSRFFKLVCIDVRIFH